MDDLTVDQKVQLLIDRDAIHVQNAKATDEALRTLNTNLNSLLELVKARDHLVEVLAESVKHHATAIDRLENLLGLQGKVPAN